MSKTLEAEYVLLHRRIKAKRQEAKDTMTILRTEIGQMERRLEDLAAEIASGQRALSLND